VSAPTPHVSWREWRTRLPWWLLLPIVCQFSFAWIGFSPTDDGWLQAVARRLLDGEVPHRDFIFLRPALSAYLQVPLIWVGGDHLIWWSRLWGWLELAAIAWLWSGIVGLTGLRRACAYVIATLLSAHTFPVMAWHTLDGLVLCTCAVALAQRGWLRTGFFCVGCAALCRQNFAFFAPILLLAVGGPWRFWFVAGFWSALPSLLYLGGLALVGGADDFVRQIAASGGAFHDAAFIRPMQKPWLWGGAAAGLLVVFLARRRPIAAPLLFLALVLLLAAQLAAGPAFVKAGAFQLFGACAVWVVAKRERLLGLSALGLAWTTLISMGYDTPILAAAPLLLVLGRLTLREFEAHPRVPLVALVVVLAVATATTWARLRYPYGDAPAWELTWNVGDALPGGSGVRTNPRTIAHLAELRELALEREHRGVPYAVLTDFSAHWISSAQRNLLLVEWAQETEIGPPGPVQDRFFAALDALPPQTEIFVQKYFAPGFGWGLLPVGKTWKFYHAQHHVQSTWTKQAETRFFEIYVRPVERSSPPTR
jgi:hypothetical protein